MADAVFDTTVFVDAYLAHPAATLMLSEVRSGRLVAGYSPLTVYELWLRMMSRREEAFHQAVLSILEEIPFDSESAHLVAGWLRQSPRSARLRLGPDAMIAAAGVAMKATIYTRNPRDFARFDVNVQSY